jgi:head-tail adaptor
MDKFVTLARCPVTTPDTDGFFEALTPSGVWAQIQPLPPQSDGRSIFYYVTIRHHAMVNMDTRVKWGPRELFVRGVQDVDQQGVEMRLYCEEVVP